MLDEGTPLPSFTVRDHRGEPVTSEDWKGHWTALWWYVKADTPG